MRKPVGIILLVLGCCFVISLLVGLSKMPPYSTDTPREAGRFWGYVTAQVVIALLAITLIIIGRRLMKDKNKADNP